MIWYNFGRRICVSGPDGPRGVSTGDMKADETSVMVFLDLTLSKRMTYDYDDIEDVHIGP